MKKTISIAVGLIITAAVLFFLFQKIDVKESINNLSVIPWYAVIGLMVIYLSGFVIRALRWRLMLGGAVELPVKTWLNSIIVGYAGNNVIPARGGELLRMEHFSRVSGVNRTMSLSSVLTEKILDGLSLLFVLLVVVWYYPGDLLSIQWFSTLFYLANLIFIGALVFIVGLKVLGNKPVDWAIAKGGVVGKIGNISKDILVSLDFVKMNLKGVTIVLLGIFVWIIEGGMFVYAFSLLTPDISYIFLGYFALVVVNFGILVPSSPGYVGVFQAMTVLACSVLGITQEAALSASLLIHACQFIPITIWGLLILGKGLFKVAAK